MKSGNLNFLEPSGPCQACNGTALTFLPIHSYSKREEERGVDSAGSKLNTKDAVKVYKDLCAVRIYAPENHLWKWECAIGMWIHITVETAQQGRIKLFGAPRQWKHFRPLFQAVFLPGGRGYYPPESNTTPPNPKKEIINILFYILNIASIIKFKM